MTYMNFWQLSALVMSLLSVIISTVSLITMARSSYRHRKKRKEWEK